MRNVVWITADVHYCAAHHYDPARARSRISIRSGNSSPARRTRGTFAPGVIDRTFGPEVRFNGMPADLKPNRPPGPDTQFFGMLEADPQSRALTVAIVNTAGTRVFEQRLEASRS